MHQAHLWIDHRDQSEGMIVSTATLEIGKERFRIWYNVPVQYRALLTKGCDHFVVGSIFTVMRKSLDLRVHGQVSPSLLCNLEEFQAAWACWRPRKYRKVEITGDIEREQRRIHQESKAVSAFSGGVDSSFTAFRYRKTQSGRVRHNLQAGLMVHGFDIPLNQGDVFSAAAKKSAELLGSLGMELITMATNLRELGENWVDACGAAVASCLMMLRGGFTGGVIPSTEPYQALVLPWGSNPVTDCLLSSDSFAIIHHGAGSTRNEKIREIGAWPEALRLLRVCWEGEQKDRNCGRCEKCIRTILNFRVSGFDLPACFERDVTDSQIYGMSGLNPVQIAEFDQIASAAKAASLSDPWVTALVKCLQRNKRQANKGVSLVRRIRKRVALRSRIRQLMSLRLT